MRGDIGFLLPWGQPGLLCRVWSRLQMVHGESETSLLRNTMQTLKADDVHMLLVTTFNSFSKLWGI